MTTLREAAKQALEALELVVVDVKTTPNAYEAQRQAITALRAALAEQPAEQEPVAWAKDTGKKLRITPMDMRGDGGWRPLGYIDTTPRPAIPPEYKMVPVEPTDEMLEMGRWLEYPESGSRMQPVRMEDVRGVWKAMLAASPEAPQPAKRVPLTREELADAWLSVERITNATERQIAFARAVIAAYDAKNGITGETK